MKVTMEMDQVLIELGDLFFKYLDTSGHDHLEFIFVTDGSFTADGGLL